MSTDENGDRATILDAIAALIRERLGTDQSDLVTRFARQYFAGVATGDLQQSEAVDLYGAVVAHYTFIKRRQVGQPRCRAYNPRAEQHGWQSTHSIVEVATDDMPFIVDSLRMAVNGLGLTNHLIVHPVMRFLRDADGDIVRMLERGESDPQAITEAVVHLEVDRQPDQQALDKIVTAIEAALADVRHAVADWRPMRERLAGILSEIESAPPPLPPAEIAEGQDFLNWLEDNHFTFLGYREYELVEDARGVSLHAVKGSGLGLLRDTAGTQASKSFSTLSAEVRALAKEPRLLVVTKANSASTVHRPGYLDYVGIKRFDGAGRVVGERRFLGLYTSAAYNRSPRAIPLLREKVGRVVAKAGYPDNSHAAKALVNILETFPRDLLFQLGEDDLQATAIGILHLQERQQVRLFAHRDQFGRYYSCLVYVPRERFNTHVRHQIQDILSAAFDAVGAEFTVQLSDSVLARLYFVFRVRPGAQPEVDLEVLESAVRDATRVWSDDLYAALLERFGEERATVLARQYAEAFRADYRENYDARVAVADVEHIEGLGPAADAIAMNLYRPLEAPGEALRFKLFQRHRPISLSDALPMLENMGLRVEDEKPCKIKRADQGRVWLHDFGMTLPGGIEIELDRIKEKFQEAFAHTWRGDAENDGFNRLVLRAGLGWREVVILRAYCKYLRQAKVAFSQAYMELALYNNPDIARLLVNLFHARFEPDAADDRESAVTAYSDEIVAALDGVSNLDEDRILRAFLGLALATVRTSFYQSGPHDGVKDYVSFKFDPAKIADLPAPRPMYEIFVYSPRVEGVHLRGGPVARGGLRWSDRREDFRTEVLGLVKAQMVKNAVIVPVGSKGGFVPKRMPVGATREVVLEEGKACYRIFIRALLDITDNLVGGEVVPPPRVVRHDSDDPYLVVAADKGTATFSDIANEIAIEYGFWLGDAFASGGSQGYDHKGMGITARGAWESVMRHFRELEVDTQSTDFTVVGIGDMSGDVFGNGMLLSPHIRLVAAFNHMHIFIDPAPDPAASFEERQRLFKLPRSSWLDYDTALISKGGGIFDRTAKSIELSPEARKALGVKDTRLAPTELMRAILCASVDLLWNGGIGTYVKATSEHHDDVGDRANDALRIDADELRCRVVGEGGNLGFTQLGRIEFALAGGHINTDAIDNAGGVDCSDHEVNIKILLNGVVAAGDLTEKQRNELLAEMTDEVGDLVLRNNYLQTQALSVAGAQSPALLEVHGRLMAALEKDSGLNRAIEFLPDGETLIERAQAGLGLSPPELSVLLAYVKIKLFKDLLASDLPGEAAMDSLLCDYFPTALRERYAAMMREHRLAAEIVSTVVANELVNRAGISFEFRLGEETGAAPVDVARSYVISKEVFGMEKVWAEIEGLDNLVPAAVQTRMLLEARKLVERGARWLLRHHAGGLDIPGLVAAYRPGVEGLSATLGTLVDGEAQKAAADRAKTLVKAGVAESLAGHVGLFEELFSGLDIADVAATVDAPVEEVASAYFELGNRLNMPWLRSQIVALPRENRWQTLARSALRDDLYTQQSALTADALRNADGLDGWFAGNRPLVERCRQVLAELKSAGRADFPMLSVVIQEIRTLRSAQPPAGSGGGTGRVKAA